MLTSSVVVFVLGTGPPLSSRGKQAATLLSLKVQSIVVLKEGIAVGELHEIFSDSAVTGFPLGSITFMQVIVMGTLVFIGAPTTKTAIGAIAGVPERPEKTPIGTAKFA
jgi:hypothetical protein